MSQKMAMRNIVQTGSPPISRVLQAYGQGIKVVAVVIYRKTLITMAMSLQGAPAG